MTAALADARVMDTADVFDLDVRVVTHRVRVEDAACQTDDGCGTTCQISACHSQS